MNVKDAILRRRSVRTYADCGIKSRDLKKIIEAGIWAPSGLNNQPWKFKIIPVGEEKTRMARFTRYERVIKNAPVAICVFLDKRVSYNREKDIMAVGACVENMLLRAYDLGLAACWLGEILNRRKKVEEYLGIGPRFELMAVITLGYPVLKETRGERKELKSFLL